MRPNKYLVEEKHFKSRNYAYDAIKDQQPMMHRKKHTYITIQRT